MPTEENVVADEKLSQWSERALAHQVVTATHVLKNLNDGWKPRLLARHIVATDLVEKYDATVIKHSPALMIEFGAMGRECTAVLFTDIDSVVLFVGKANDEFEMVGYQDPDGFWQYLDSFPNWYKNLTSNCERAQYWRK